MKGIIRDISEVWNKLGTKGRIKYMVWFIIAVMLLPLRFAWVFFETLGSFINGEISPRVWRWINS